MTVTTPLDNHYYFVTVLLLFSLLAGCSSSTDLEWHQEEHYRWAKIKTGFFGSTGFKALSSRKTNIDFNNILLKEEVENRHYLNGSGVAAGDVDGDGLVDLYFTSLSGSNKLYKNLGGMTFQDITVPSGVAHEGYVSTGAVFADIDGDGHPDLLVTAMHGENVLYLNDGTGSFSRDPDSGIGQARGGMSMTLADLTGNGYLDLYLVNYKEESMKDLFTAEELEWENVLNEPLRDPTDIYTLAPPFDRYYELDYLDGQLAGLSEIGEPDELYLNNGGRFEKVEDTHSVFLDENGDPFGLQPDWGLSAKFQDLNGDGRQDLYVCNDFQTPDRIWINNGDGTFQAINRMAIRNLSFACMGVDFSDINRDGRLDIFTTEMLNPDHRQRLRVGNSGDPLPVQPGDLNARPLYNRNSLFLGREDHTFAEISNFSGVTSTGWSWDATFMDVDLDGYEDILVTTGYLSQILNVDTQIELMNRGLDVDEHFSELLAGSPPLNISNKILMNNGDLTFTEMGGVLGFTEEDISQGMAVADLNNDGTLDIIINRMNSEAAIYENRTRNRRIAVRLRGDNPNTFGIGASVELLGGPVGQSKQIAAGGDYLSGSDSMVMFAAGAEDGEHTIVVHWPDGRTSRIEGVQGNRIYEISQSGADGPLPTTSNSETATDPMDSMPDPMDSAAKPADSMSNPMFEDASDRIAHTHHEDPFLDFEIQPLLPYRKSRSGPGIALLDVTGNGRDDLLIGSGRGGHLALLENRPDGRFEPLETAPLTRSAPGDQTAVLGWKENGQSRIVIGSANFEQPRLDAASAYLAAIDASGEVAHYDSLPGVRSTTGPIAAADVNRDGTIDLFVGGAFNPGQYPNDASSRLYLNRDGVYTLDERTTQLFDGLGLVNGALFADITGNGWQDLLVSTEWGTLRLFENTGGQAIRPFREVTAAVGLDRYHGWWQGISTGDFNGDGRLDIAATNMGLNSPWQYHDRNPLRMYFTDLDSDGRTDIIEAYAGEDGRYLPRLPLYRFESLQISLNHMSSHGDFADATVTDILGELYAERIPVKQINELSHMVFLNGRNGFEARPLPLDAQFSAGFHPGIADFDNDGHEDLFLSQNLFALQQGRPRLDAGRGIVLLGDGTGGFRPLSGSESGVRIYGEQRGAALGDLDGDGRTDLVVSQNGAETKLYLNRTEKRGIRVSLAGPVTNRNGIGSAIRLIYPDGTKGPVRTIQAGSGYWSQNSYTAVMGYSSQPDKIEVTWFDGNVQEIDIEENRMDYTVTW